jgi:hypothetical protein
MATSRPRDEAQVDHAEPARRGTEAAEASAVSVPAPPAAAPAEWETPFPYGHLHAIESAGGVAAPLLAATSFSLIGLIVPNTEVARLPSIALSFLVLAALALVAAVQCMFWAREWAVTPAEIREWEPTADERWIHDVQRLHMAAFRLWAKRFRWTYRLGIVFLLLGVAVVLVPNGDVSTPRLVAIVLAWAGLALELLWIAAGWLLRSSPDGTWTTEPDAPSADVPFRGIRAWPPARRVARRFVPLVRVDRTAERGPPSS